MLNPRCRQKLAANGHWKSRCSAVSGELKQRSHVWSATIFFLWRLDLHCSLPCITNHAKNWTRGGAQELQKFPKLGSDGSMLDLIILYNPDVCSTPLSNAKAELRLSLWLLRITRDSRSLTLSSSVATSVVKRRTRWCLSPSATTKWTGWFGFLQWLYSAGNCSAMLSSPAQTSCQNDVDFPSPNWTVVIAW